MMDPANRYPGRTLFGPIQKVEKIAPHTVRFVLAHPWPVFLKFISEDIYSSTFIPSPKAVDSGVHDMEPVGAGPL